MSNVTPDLAKIVSSQPWYERAIAAVAPAYGLKRMQARVQQHLFAYQAAQSDRLYAPRTYGQAAETTQTERSRVVMMWEALDLVENFPLAKAAISRYGLFLTPTEYAPATGSRDYDAILADYFHAWCKRADATNRHSFRKLVQLAAEMRPAYGDVGFALRRVDGEIKLQLVPGDRLGNPNELLFSDMGDGRYYYSGVITDAIGRPSAYRIFRINDANSWVDPEDIAAANFCHYFDPFRVDQYRGVTDFHAVARTARMLKEILEAEMAGVRFASQNAALVFTERGAAASRNLFTPANAATLPTGEKPQQELSDVANIKYLYTGDKVEVMPSRPGTAFNGFVQTLMNDIALGLGGYPTGVLWGTQDFKGPSVRAEFAQADRVNARHQGILTDKVLDPIKNAVILDAIAREVLPPPPREAGESIEQAVIRATRGTFRFPPRLTIDVGRESQARISELNNGAGSLQEIAAEDGRDAFTRLEEKAQAAAWIKQLSEKYDVPETAIILPGGQLPSTPAAAAAVGETAGEEAAEAQAAASSGGSEAAPEGPVDEFDIEDVLQINLEDGSYIPTARMAANARRALEVRSQKPISQRGMTAVGIARARDISRRRPLSEETVRRMKAYFDRHEVDKQGETWGEQGKGWQAWNGWGGDEGYSWAKRIVEMLNRDERGNRTEASIAVDKLDTLREFNRVVSPAKDAYSRELESRLLTELERVKERNRAKQEQLKAVDDKLREELDAARRSN